MLGSEIVLALVHAGVGFFHLLLDFLLHLFLLGFRHGRLEALALLAGLGGFLVVVLFLGRFLSLNLGNIYLLGTAALDAFALFGAFGVKLGQVNLAHHLEGGCAFLGCRGFRWGRGGFRLCFRFRLCYRLRLRLCYRLRLGFCYRFRLRLCYRFRFRLCHWFRLRFCHRFRLGLHYRLRFRFGLCHGFRFRHNGAGQVVVLDDGHPLGLELVFFLVLFLGSLVQNFGKLYVHLLRLFLQLQVFSELLVQFRQVFVGNLQVWIGILDSGPLGVKELHQGVQTDIELFNEFR